MVAALALHVAACGDDTQSKLRSLDATIDTGRTPADDAGPQRDGATGSDARTSESPESGRSESDASSTDVSSDAGVARAQCEDLGPVGDAIGVTAARASDFLNSLGANTHLGQGADKPDESAEAFRYAGLRILRDQALPGVIPKLLRVFELTGVRMAVNSNRTIADVLEAARALKAVNALLAVEGPNEANNFPVSYEGVLSQKEVSFLPVAKFQRDLYAAVKADPALRAIPVFHSSEGGGASPDNVGLQYLTIPKGAQTAMPDGTRYADYGNLHNYPGGSIHKVVDNYAWNAADPTLDGAWDGLFGSYGETWKKGFPGYTTAQLVMLPRVSTETGWPTRGEGALSEEQQGRVLMSVFLSSFARGFTYTFMYMLRDDPTQGAWGLFDASYKAKASGVYMHNLTTILADDCSRAPGRLEYAVRQPVATIHSLLLQKSSGVFELVLWNERAEAANFAVTVSLPLPRERVRIFDPTVGTEPTMTFDNVSEIPVTLSDHPVVIEL